MSTISRRDLMRKLTLLTTSLLAVLAFSQATFATNTSEQISTKIKDQKAQTSQKIQKVNLNSANAKEIAKTLTGIGMKKAAAIVEYRKAHGVFKSIEELASVKGISVKTIAKNQGRILLK